MPAPQFNAVLGSTADSDAAADTRCGRLNPKLAMIVVTSEAFCAFPLWLGGGERMNAIGVDRGERFMHAVEDVIGADPARRTTRYPRLTDNAGS